MFGNTNCCECTIRIITTAGATGTAESLCCSLCNKPMGYNTTVYAPAFQEPAPEPKNRAQRRAAKAVARRLRRRSLDRAS